MIKIMDLQDDVNKALSILPVLESEFFNPKLFSWKKEPYIQHIPSVVDESQFLFLEICRQHIKIDKWLPWCNIHRQGFMGRIIDDSGSKELYGAWVIFMCIDELYREWSQPSFAYNFKRYDADNSFCINNDIPELKTYFRDFKIDLIIKK